MKLFTNFRSPASHRLRIALRLKGVDHSSEYVHLADGAHRRPEYATLNPLRTVPILIEGPQVMVQSLAIMEFLEELYPEPPLLPAEPLARARVRGLADTIACEIHPLLTRRVLAAVQERFQPAEGGIDSWYAHWIAEGFSAVERMLSDDAATGTYSHGDNVTVADVCLVPQVTIAEERGCDLSPYPTIQRITEACRALPAFIDAAPSNQPDAA